MRAAMVMASDMAGPSGKAWPFGAAGAAPLAS